MIDPRPLALLVLITLTPPGRTEPSSTAPARELYVAVGYGGRRVSSHDGVHWENDQEFINKGQDDEFLLCDIAYGKGRFVAVGGGIFLTLDGKDWRKVAEPKGRTPVVAFGDGVFVAGHSEEFLVSSDGEKWEQGAKIQFNGGIHFRRCAFGNHRFVLIADSNPTGKHQVNCRCITPDGRSVTEFQTETPSVHGIAFGVGRFVVVGEGGVRESSTDGQHWDHPSKEPGEDFFDIIWDGRQFIVGGAPHAYTSPDGIIWTKHEKRIPCSLFCGTVDGPHIGGTGRGILWHSDDGLNWINSETTSENSIAAVAFGAASQ